MNALLERPSKMAMNALQASIRSLPTAEAGEGGAAIARKWAAQAVIIAQLATDDGATQRTARLLVSYGTLARLFGPWAVRLWEVDAPDGVSPVEWIVATRRSISDVEDALHVLENTHGLVSSYRCS